MKQEIKIGDLVKRIDGSKEIIDTESLMGLALKFSIQEPFGIQVKIYWLEQGTYTSLPLWYIKKVYDE